MAVGKGEADHGEDWQEIWNAGLRRSWPRCGIRPGAECVRPMSRDRSALAIASACSRWRRAIPTSPTTSCTTSLASRPMGRRTARGGAARRSRQKVGGDAAWLIVDDTALPKKGVIRSVLLRNMRRRSARTPTARRWCRYAGFGEVPVMVALRLFCPRAGRAVATARPAPACPMAEFRRYRTKPEIALAEIDGFVTAGVRFGGVLADAGYGMSAPFRQGLTARRLAWAVGIPGRQKVYPADVKLIFPIAGRGRPRQRHIPDVLSTPAEDLLSHATWREVSWRAGTKGQSKARFAAVRVRIADGSPQRIGDKGRQHLPGDQAWLIGEHRTSGEKKYYLANLPGGMDLRALARSAAPRSRSA